MVTIILTAIFSAAGICYLNLYNGSSLGEQIIEPPLLGASLGLLVGVPLSFIITMMAPRKYIPLGEKIDLLPLVDGKTYLVKNEHGNIFYKIPREGVLTAQSEEIAFVKVSEEVEYPYFTSCKAERNCFWGIFGAFFLLPEFKGFAVPKETMIRHGWVFIKTKQKHELALV